MSEPEPPTPVVELCRLVPLDERPSLLMRMVAGLSPEVQLDLLEQLVARLPADVAQQLEKELRARLARCST